MTFSLQRFPSSFRHLIIINISHKYVSYQGMSACCISVARLSSKRMWSLIRALRSDCTLRLALQRHMQNTETSFGNTISPETSNIKLFLIWVSNSNSKYLFWKRRTFSTSFLNRNLWWPNSRVRSTQIQSWKLNLLPIRFTEIWITWFPECIRKPNSKLV